MWLFQDFHPLAAIATTPTAAKTLQPLCHTAGATLPMKLKFPQTKNQNCPTVRLSAIF
ncbi:MAG: hypothetical protein RID53_27560 [Coleofasciculus sp. B1-GNL1-01]|uniref:hypothetical protein n=1 Tax=Coleofasciculus sp. B1-GNL1-01 TaxID=3068484 RepID=UPI0033018F80